MKSEKHIKVRKAQPEDFVALAHLFLQSRRSAFRWQDAAQFKLEDFYTQTAGEVIFLAENEDGKLLGFISGWEADSFLHHLFISPQHQRAGIGTLLLNSLFSWLPLPYRLKCVAKNESALAFYRKNGFIEIGRGSGDDGEYVLLELATTR